MKFQINHSVLKSGCTVYTCINAATSIRACSSVVYILYATALYGVLGAASIVCIFLSYFSEFHWP